MQVRVAPSEDFGKCGCGRSPTGKCLGWHALSDEQYEERKRQWDIAEYTRKAQKPQSDNNA